MPLIPHWQDIAVRLALTMLAGALLGLDRGARGQAAGLRTTILVSLAAALAMIQANLLLPVGGKNPASFGVLDLMRLPLGILTGVGFIGGGAILKRGDIVRGVTTAATLWVATVIGLCFGGGQIRLGLAGMILAIVTLFLLDWLDRRIPRQHHARLVMEIDKDGDLSEAPKALAPHRVSAALFQQLPADRADHIRLGFEITWRRREVDGPSVDVFEFVNRRFNVVSFEVVSETSH